MKWFVALLGLVCAVLVSIHVRSCGEGFREKSPALTELDTLRDTVVYIKPLAVRDTVVRYVTVELPVVARDTVFSQKTRVVTRGESVTVEVPITSRTYSDSLYYAVVSGYKPSLDSLRVFNNTLLKTVYRPEYRRWNFGVNAGYGYGLLHGKPDVYVGVGVTYNLFK